MKTKTQAKTLEYYMGKLEPEYESAGQWKSARKGDPGRRRKRTHLGATIRRLRAASSGYFPSRVLFFFTDSRNR